MLIFKRRNKESVLRAPIIPRVVKTEQLDVSFTKAYEYMLKFLGRSDAQTIWLAGQRIYDLKERHLFYTHVVVDIEEKILHNQKISYTQNHAIFQHQPVGVEEFINSPYYLDKSKAIYPVVLREAIKLNSGSYVEAVLTGGIGCLSGDTEYLTETGWGRFDSYAGERIAQYNPGNAQIEFVAPEFTQQPCLEFWNFKTKYGLDMMLSEEHRVLYRTPKNHLRVLPASEVARQHNTSVKGFTGKFLTTFDTHRQGVALTTFEIRLQVAVQADGTFNPERSGHKVSLNLKKYRKKERLTQLLKEAGIPYSVSHFDSGYCCYYFDAPLRTKDYAWAWECSPTQLQVISEEAVWWGGDQKSTFYTTKKLDADFMCYCFSATQKRAVVEEDRRGFCDLLYSVRGNPNTEITMQGVPKTEMRKAPSPDGKKYCFTVPTGFFVARRNGRVFITGNSAKTTLALYTNLYQLYLLSCMRSPHQLYGLDPSSEILLIFQSITKNLAKSVDFARFKSMVEGSKYFREHYPFDKKLESKLVFPNRIEVVPVSGSETAAIGQNVIGGLIDELNYMAIVEKSKQSVDKGTFDQAVAVYNSIARRRKSRFLEQGQLPGILCLVSSKKYPGQFTDQKMEEAKTDPTVYVYDKRVWDVKPAGTFTKGWFHVFIGDLTRKPRILLAKEEVALSDRPLVMKIPLEYLKDFQRDIINALREIAGVSTLARHPFFLEVDKVNAAFGKHKSIFSRDVVDFSETRLTIVKERFFSPELPRFVHIDLAISGDSAGLAVGTVTGFMDIREHMSKIAAAQMSIVQSIAGDSGGSEAIFMPKFHIDGVLEIRPPKNSEILFWKVREVILAMRRMGLNIRWVTFDQFQCVSGKTNMWTSQGLLPASEVQEGVVVPSRSGPRKITKKWSFGLQSARRITTSDGMSTEATHKHRFEVATSWRCIKGGARQLKVPVWGWRKVKDLQIGDVLRTARVPCPVDVAELQTIAPFFIKCWRSAAHYYTVPGKLNEDLACLVGLLYGDGCLDQDGLHITCALNEAEDACAAIQRVFREAEPSVTFPSDRQCANVSLSSRDAVRWLKSNGFDKLQAVPQAILRSPIRVQAAFISGLFSTDGSVSQVDGKCSYSTSIKERAEYVHVFLRSALGIDSCICYSKRTNCYPTVNEFQYIVNVRGSRQEFLEAVGFVYKDKQNLLQKFSTIKGRRLWTRVKRLEEVQAEVFDFEVEGDPSYLADGLVSHNSTDSQQLLRQRGFITGKQSVDEVPCRAYDFAKAAIYEGRVDMPPHKHAQMEILMLEKDTKTGKVDHPPSGSKDCADSIAAIIYGLTMRREIWGMYGIPLMMIPSSVTASADKLKTPELPAPDLSELGEMERVQQRIR